MTYHSNNTTFNTPYNKVEGVERGLMVLKCHLLVYSHNLILFKDKMKEKNILSSYFPIHLVWSSKIEVTIKW